MTPLSKVNLFPARRHSESDVVADLMMTMFTLLMTQQTSARLRGPPPLCTASWAVIKILHRPTSFSPYARMMRYWRKHPKSLQSLFNVRTVRPAAAGGFSLLSAPPVGSGACGVFLGNKNHRSFQFFTITRTVLLPVFVTVAYCNYPKVIEIL